MTYAYNFHQKNLSTRNQNYRKVSYDANSVIENRRIDIVMGQSTVGMITADDFTSLALYMFANKVTKI